jgi:hypothetical protein
VPRDRRRRIAGDPEAHGATLGDDAGGFEGGVTESRLDVARERGWSQVRWSS